MLDLHLYRLGHRFLYQVLKKCNTYLRCLHLHSDVFGKGVRVSVPHLVKRVESTIIEMLVAYACILRYYKIGPYHTFGVV